MKKQTKSKNVLSAVLAVICVIYVLPVVVVVLNSFTYVLTPDR